jgi:hypothetical protein
LPKDGQWENRITHDRARRIVNIWSPKEITRFARTQSGWGKRVKSTASHFLRRRMSIVAARTLSKEVEGSGTAVTDTDI